MKKNSVIPTPCPKCGSNFLAHGKPYGCTTPRILAWLGSLHDVICVSCGHYAPTVKAWNGEWEKKKMSSEGIWKAAAWLASAAVAVACILKTGNADFLQILAFPFFVCILT